MIGNFALNGAIPGKFGSLLSRIRLQSEPAAMPAVYLLFADHQPSSQRAMHPVVGAGTVQDGNGRNGALAPMEC